MSEEDEGGPDRDPDDGWGEEPDGGGLRGWIPPDDRLWRHPSESGQHFIVPEPAGVATAQPSNQARSGPRIVGGATACLVVALVAAGMIMVANGTDQHNPSNPAGLAALVGSPTTDPGLGRTDAAGAIAAMVDSVRPSTVLLRIHRRTGVSSTTGVVVESGGIIVTPAPVLSGARSITAVEPDGTRQPATVVGIDQRSGVAVLRIDDDLPAAIFDNGDLSVGSIAIASTLRPGRKSHALPSSLVYAGAVVSSGQAADLDAQTTSFSATTVRTPLAHDDLGCPLLDGNGHVAGILEMTRGKGASTTGVFLPSELVLGVALQLVASGTVDHGWMGMKVRDADTATTASDSAVMTSTSVSDGARVDTVDFGSPAATAGLQPGDVITGIDGYPVHSAAELQTRLYPDPPGTDLALSFERGTTIATVPVVLADQDGGAQRSGSSP